MIKLLKLLEGWRREDEGQGQFAYQEADRAARERRREAEWTEALKACGAWIDPVTLQTVNTDKGDFSVEASVIIPVRNRAHTIADAVKSALGQEAPFDHNVIVVDNASTDGTSEILAAIDDPRLVVIDCDEAEGLTIGDCWNRAAQSPHCGRFAIQLDSDDIYSGPDTIARIVAKMRQEGAAMLAGAYRLVDIDLNEIPPGIIAHEEWTAENGHNNLLRVNGVGAPRAFLTPVFRANPMPASSYGEDYGVALAISGQWRVARIYDVLYLCRRWEGNSDACETPELHLIRQNYKDALRREAISRRQLRNFSEHLPLPIINEDIVERLIELQGWPEVNPLEERHIGSYTVKLLPARAASVHADLTQERPCFLCEANRHPEQLAVVCDGMHFLVNPRPVMLGHLTIAAADHRPQVADLGAMARVAATLPGFTVFFNSPGAGASAPDHFHLQAFRGRIEGLRERIGARAFNPEKDMLPRCFNLFCTCEEGRLEWTLFPRKKHRPDNYGECGVSPGSLEMAGVITVTTQGHYDRLTDAVQIDEILKDVSL